VSYAPRLARLEAALGQRRADGLFRQRRVVAAPTGPRTVVDDRPLLAFASNDYLGLANHPAVIEAARDAAQAWGVGAGASHLVSGHTAAHDALERELATFVAPGGDVATLLFSSGYLANLAILSVLAGRTDAIFADRLNHACLNDGALLARATMHRYAHGDVDALSRALASPLPPLLELAEQHDAWLIVDDAHGFGVLGAGRGTLAHFNMASERIVAMGTLGKAAGVAGAFVAAHPVVIESLVQTARPYIYTTATPPLLAQALRAALTLIRDDHARRAALQARIAQFRAGAAALPWSLLPSQTAIQPLVVGDSGKAMALSDALLAQGIWVPAIRPPTVPAGTARLRVSLSAAHTEADVDALLRALATAA
jgi:8-amino-7-oxononanoate synthase